MSAPIIKTNWYHYLLAFLAGVFFVNMLPHYVMGITGRMFPTPFADPPGVGLSSSTVNVLWATINFVVSLCIFYFAKISYRDRSLWIAVIIGGILMSFYVADYFAKLA